MSKLSPAVLIISLSILVSTLFVAYYFLIARPKIKAECMNAATRVTNQGWERVIFDEAKYKERIKIL